MTIIYDLTYYHIYHIYIIYLNISCIYIQFAFIFYNYNKKFNSKQFLKELLENNFFHKFNKVIYYVI